ncbi:MAG: hypothetical protein ACYCV7_11095 [Acidimicrobiales bacterium]
MHRGRNGRDAGARWSWFQGTAAASPQRLVQVLLGCVWLADGALQLQPFMFGRGFVTDMLLPTAQGNPVPVAGSITAMAHFLEPHIALWNALFAVIQLAIGAGLLVRRTVRPALAVSFAWSLAVWWFAEGLGGMLTGHGTDPNTGPLLALAALAWYRIHPEPKARRVMVPASVARAVSREKRGQCATTTPLPVLVAHPAQACN